MPWQLKKGGYNDRALRVVASESLREWEVEEVARMAGMDFRRAAQALCDLFRKSKVGRVSVRSRGHARSEFTFHLWNEERDRVPAARGPEVSLDELAQAVSRMSVRGVFHADQSKGAQR